MHTSLSQKYGAMQHHRDEFVDRAEEVSRLTIPYAFSGDEYRLDSTRGEMPDPHQSIGARGIRNITSKLSVSLFPPNSPFFSFRVDDELKSDLPEGVTEGDIDLAMNKLTRQVHDSIVGSNLRTEATEIFMSLMVDGNPLIYVDENLKFTVYRLNQFVVSRDMSDNIQKIILKETFAADSLINNKDVYKILVEEGKEGDKHVDIYTGIMRDEDGGFIEYQEVCDKRIPNSESKYPEEKMPWILPRISKITGESYGRSYGEEFLGDLRAYEGLSKALLDMAAASSRVIFMVKSTAALNLRNLNKARNGSFVAGDANQISPFQANLGGDFNVVRAQAQSIEERLSQAFLLVSSVQRNAERVTAEEIRLMADELDRALGGIFSLLAAELQLKVVRVVVNILKRQGIVKLPADVKPTLVTGVDALGRGQDLGRLNQFINNVLQLSQAFPEMSQRLNGDELLGRLAAAHGIDPLGLVKPEEQIQAEQQQAQIQQQQQQALNSPLVQKVAEQALKGEIGDQ